jgi:hypothetical protein
VRANIDIQENRSRESEKSSEEKITDNQIKTVDQEFTHREDLATSFFVFLL